MCFVRIDWSRGQNLWYRQAARELIKYIRSGGTLDPPLADQTVPYLVALITAGKGRNSKYILPKLQHIPSNKNHHFAGFTVHSYLPFFRCQHFMEIFPGPFPVACNTV